MIERVCRGKRLADGEWVEGYYVRNDVEQEKHYIVIPISEFLVDWHEVDPNTVGSKTGAFEFVNAQPEKNRLIFEGDIVALWSMRRVSGEGFYTAKSQYDGKCLVRAVVAYKNGEWYLDYTNRFNEALAAARGGELYDRVVNNTSELYHMGHNRNRDYIEQYRKSNPKGTAHDIWIIGNVHDNPELLGLP